nr:hypothetical protein [Rhabdothermincola sediminis]
MLFRDADERIPPDDAAALRAFLAGDALASLAYGMRCDHMIGDLDHPVDRIVSHYYYYMRSQSRDPVHDRALEGVESLEDYVCSSAFASLVNNGQTRLVGAVSARAGSPADAEVLAAAKAVLDRSDVVVGLQERFDESLLLFIVAGSAARVATVSGWVAASWWQPARRRRRNLPERRVAGVPPLSGR